MEWTELYGKEIQPSPKDIAEFINNSLWVDMNEFLQVNYDVEPVYSYSGCSGQPGWNVKYKKSGKSLCVLYPMDGYFIALVTIGKKEEPETLMILPTCTEYLQELYSRSQNSGLGKWLMIEVKDEDILEDVKNLIQIRRRIKR